MTKEEFLENIRVKFKTSPRDRKTGHVVAEMRNDIRRLVLAWRNIYIDFAVPVKVVPRCIKCGDLGYTKNRCHAEAKVCLKCGKACHKKTDCPDKEKGRVCIPCTLRKRNCADKAEECPTNTVMLERFI